MDLDYVGPVRALLLTSHVTAVTIRFLFLSPRTMETTKEPVHSVVAGGNRARAALFTKRSENGNCCKNLLAWEGSCSYPFAARKLGCYFAFNSLKNCEELSK